MITKRFLYPSIRPFHLSSSFSNSTIESQPNKLDSPHSLSESLSQFHRSIEDYPNSLPSYSFCNTLIDNLRKAKHYDLVIYVHSKMVSVSVFPCFTSLSALIESFVNIQKPSFAFGVLGLMIKRGYDVNVYNMNLLLKGFCQIDGDCDKALDLFSTMKRNCVLPDSFSYNTVINGLCKAKRLVEARHLFEDMKVGDCKPDLVTFSTLVYALCKNTAVEEGFGFLEEMEKMGFEADEFVYTTLINGFCNKGDIGRGKQLFNEMLRKNVAPNVAIYSCLMNALCKKRKWEEA